MNNGFRYGAFRIGMIVVGVILGLSWSSITGCWHHMTSTCTKLITSEDLEAVGGKNTSSDSYIFDSKYFCDASWGNHAVGLELQQSVRESYDLQWRNRIKNEGATEEALGTDAWLLEGKDLRTLVVKRPMGAMRLELKKSEYSAEQARQLLQRLQPRWIEVDRYFAHD